METFSHIFMTWTYLWLHVEVLMSSNHPLIKVVWTAGSVFTPTCHSGVSKQTSVISYFPFKHEWIQVKVRSNEELKLAAAKYMAKYLTQTKRDTFKVTSYGWGQVHSGVISWLTALVTSHTHTHGGRDGQGEEGAVYACWMQTRDVCRRSTLSAPCSLWLQGHIWCLVSCGWGPQASNLDWLSN